MNQASRVKHRQEILTACAGRVPALNHVQHNIVLRSDPYSEGIRFFFITCHQIGLATTFINEVKM